MNEEIIKAVEFHAKKDDGIGYIDGYTPKVIKFADILDLIHRLQSENAELKTENESFGKTINQASETLRNQRSKIERLKTENGNQVHMRCDMQRKYDDLQELCTEQKAEIERLKDEKYKVEQNLKQCENGYEQTLHIERYRVGELQKQVEALTSSCQSKNAKIKNLNAEKQALENELNFQNGKPHYRYVIWNTKRNERQFPSICELTESGAYTKLFQKIGWDSAKYRFVVKRIKVDGVEVE
jgi:uncharacterized phage infection (PIP) family protein YhgE